MTPSTAPSAWQAPTALVSAGGRRDGRLAGGALGQAGGGQGRRQASDEIAVLARPIATAQCGSSTAPRCPSAGSLPPHAAVTFRSTSFKAAEDADKQVAEEGIADDTPVASKAGLVGWVFLASAALSVAGTFIALGGIGALQAYCDDNGVLGHVVRSSCWRPWLPVLTCRACMQQRSQCIRPLAEPPLRASLPAATSRTSSCLATGSSRCTGESRHNG